MFLQSVMIDNHDQRYAIQFNSAGSVIQLNYELLLNSCNLIIT